MSATVYTDTKPCAYPPCRTVLLRRPGEGPARWAKRRHCQRRCGMLNRGEILPESKVCAFDPCAAEFSRPPGMGRKRWAAMTHCSRSCAVATVAGHNRIPDDARQCKTCALPGCDVVMVRDPQRVSAKAWSVRKTCSTAHRIARQRGQTAEQAAAGIVPPRPVPPSRRPENRRAKAGSTRPRGPRKAPRKAPSGRAAKPAPGVEPGEPRAVFAGPAPVEPWRPANIGRDMRPRVA